MTKKGHVSGGKAVATHTSVTEQAEKLANAAKKIPAVNRVLPGQIKRVSGGSHRNKVVSQEQGALVIEVRMPLSIQELVIYTGSPDFVLKELRKKFTIHD